VNPDGLTIRLFDRTRDSDYEAWVAVRNAALPEYTSTVEETKSGDARLDKRCVRLRWLGEAGGEVVGGCSSGQIAWAFHPDRYDTNVAVRPDRQGRGYGGALYDHVRRVLIGRGAEAILTNVREDFTRSLRFVRDRGFVETMREWESRLDVVGFDSARWDEVRQRPLPHGIVIKTLTELASDPERDRKVWDLENDTSRDVPSTEEHVDLPFETYRSMVLDNPNLLPDAFIIAVEEATGRYVGSSNLWRRPADSDLQTGLTAVRREYRRMGVALAMKLRAIDYARRVGAPVIRTENATTNRGMLAINEALGFVKQPAWISFVNELKPKTGATVERLAAMAGAV
jgi:GNAT superfamily N-acetyltransferase